MEKKVEQIAMEKKAEQMANEKKAMELCEEAKIGAEAVVMAEGKAEEVWTASCIDALDRLNKSYITCPLLVSTQLVKHLLPLINHPRKKIQEFASDLIVSWRSMFLEQIRDGDKGSYSIPCHIEPANIESVIVKKVDKRTSEDYQEISDVRMVKVHKVGQNTTPGSSKVGTSETVDNVMFENLIREPGKASGIILQKLSRSMMRCNDSFREVVREKVSDALSMVFGEAAEEIRDEVNACDSVRVAIAVESAMFEKWGRFDGPYKIKYRVVLGNLKDPKNPDFRRKVLIRQVKPERIVNMTGEEMATDKMQCRYQRWKEDIARRYKELKELRKKG